MQKFIILGVALSVIALGACRREEPSYEPMKLGGNVEESSVATR